jgi:hypothetical protein
MSDTPERPVLLSRGSRSAKLEPQERLLLAVASPRLAEGPHRPGLRATWPREEEIRHVQRSLLGLVAGPCEHLFVTYEGSPHSRFRRAIERGNLYEAEASARELGHVSLKDALSLVLLYANHEDPRFDAAAVRWLARFAAERRGLRLPELQLAVAALACVPGQRHERAEKVLLRLL